MFLAGAREGRRKVCACSWALLEGTQDIPEAKGAPLDKFVFLGVTGMKSAHRRPRTSHKTTVLRKFQEKFGAPKVAILRRGSIKELAISERS